MRRFEWHGSDWVAAEPGRNCFSIGYGLLPHSEARDRRDIPADAPAGEYRFAVRVHPEWQAGSIEVVGNVFEIRSGH